MSSSDLSSSSPASPAASEGPQEPSLDQLVLHFVAAKRSLISTSHGWRADELVTSSRALIEEIAILDAKNIFARRNIDGHVNSLQDIRDGIADAGKRVMNEFKSTIADLDQANGRLQDTLKALKETILHQSLRKSDVDPKFESSQVDNESEHQTVSYVSKSADEGTSSHRTLHDFILETDHEDILASLRSLIDSFQDAHGEFDEDLNTLDSNISDLVRKISHQYTTSPSLQKSSTTSPPLFVRTLFTSLEAHTTSMATLLESLIAHYDLCVSALKHTEGGGHAAFVAAKAEHLTKSAGSSTAGTEESLYRKVVPEPISQLERAEMLSVLVSDAEEVNDVVSELRDRNADMETQYAHLLSHARRSRTIYRQLRSVVTALHHLRTTTLPFHLHALRAFTKTWKVIHGDITTKTAALIALTDFHVHFLDAYAKLLVEIERRGTAEAKMRRVADKAQRELDRLWELDCEAREAFMEDAGQYLPGDLYPAVGSGSRKWVLAREGAQERQIKGEDSGDNVWMERR